MRCTTLLVPAASGAPSVAGLLRRQPQVEHVSVVEHVGGVVAFVCWSRGRADHAAEQRLHDHLYAVLLVSGVRPLALGAAARR